MGPIFFFAGAGASKAVSPAYPTTVEFFDRLPEAVTALPLFSQVAEFLKSGNASQVLDIERMLWALGEWEEFSDAAATHGHLPGWLLRKPRLQALGIDRFDPRPSLEVLKTVGSLAKDMTSLINQNVYSLYRRPPEQPELERTWLPLLKEALSLGSRVDVFTTNYDLILEQAILTGRLQIETGRTKETTSRLAFEMWDTSQASVLSRRTGLLTKLHGSVDWIRDDVSEGIFVGTPRFTGQHQQHAIIYPGFKGVPKDTPFTYFHDYMRTAADQAVAAIFVGFAFRDEHIRMGVRERLRPGVPILIVGLGDEPPDIPFRQGQYKYLDEGLTPEVVRDVSDWLRRSMA